MQEYFFQNQEHQKLQFLQLYQRNVSLTKLSDDVLSKDYLEFISSQILDVVNVYDSSTLEISKTGASVIQHNDYRIAITHPPFSESLEITIVHPIVKLSLEDYEISDELMKRFSDRAEGIMISEFLIEPASIRAIN